jgi:two-component system sensor histidine kinase KdpD
MAENEKESVKPGVGPVVVALGYGESGLELVRVAGALARDAGAGLECLTIETGESDDGEGPGGEGQADAQGFARSLGAVLASEPGIDVASGILKYAKRRGASALVVGMGRKRAFRRSVADSLAFSKPGCPIVGIRPAEAAGEKARMRSARSYGQASQYGAAILVIAAVTALNLLLSGFAGYEAAAIPYLAAISLMALFLDRWPVLFAALLSAAAWDGLFIPPRFTMVITKTEDLLMLGLYFLVAICAGLVTVRLRSSERLLAAREERMSSLGDLARELAGARDIETILSKSVEAVEEIFDVEAIVILREKGGALRDQAESGWEPLDSSARDAARLCFEGMRGTGRFTRTLPDSEWHFVPLKGPRGCLGVVGLRAAHDRAWNEGLESFLRTVALTASIAVARETASE